MKTYCGSGGIAPRILGRRYQMEVSGQLHAPAALPERAPVGTHCIGGWVLLRAGLDAVAKRKFPSPRSDSNPDHPARSQSLYRLSYPGPWRDLSVAENDTVSEGTTR
jgi:hypothetical protein